MTPTWFMFNGMAINKFHVCTVKASKSDTATDNYHTQISLSNGLVVEENYENEDSCAKRFAEITGIGEF